MHSVVTCSLYEVVKHFLQPPKCSKGSDWRLLTQSPPLCCRMLSWRYCPHTSNMPNTEDPFALSDRHQYGTPSSHSPSSHRSTRADRCFRHPVVSVHQKRKSDEKEKSGYSMSRYRFQRFARCRPFFIARNDYIITRNVIRWTCRRVYGEHFLQV